MIRVYCCIYEIMYWLIVPPPSPGDARSTYQLSVFRLHFHGVNAVYVVANLFVSRFPIRLLQVIYPVTFGVIYTAFTAIYFALKGTNQHGEPYIYKAIDWSKPGKTFVLTSLSNFLFIPMVHCTLWILCFAIERCTNHNSHNHSHSICQCKNINDRLAPKHNSIENIQDSQSEDQFNGGEENLDSKLNAHFWLCVSTVLILTIITTQIYSFLNFFLIFFF